MWKLGTAFTSSLNGHKTIAGLSSENGAIAREKTIEVASHSGKEGVKDLIRNALKLQSS